MNDEHVGLFEFEWGGDRYLIKARSANPNQHCADPTNPYASYYVYIEKEDLSGRKYWDLIIGKEWEVRMVARYLAEVLGKEPLCPTCNGSGFPGTTERACPTCSKQDAVPRCASEPPPSGRGRR